MAKRAIRLQWGVAGCGRYTEKTFLPGLKTLKKSEFVSIYSSDIKRAKQLNNQFSGKYAFDDFKKFLASDFDALYIGSKNSDHYWQVIEAAKAGKHILCEKPLAITAKQAKEMVDVCKKHGVKLSSNYVMRVHPLIQKSKELINKDVIGKLVNISATFNTNYAPNDNFRFNKKLSGGGALRDIGTHMIDLMLYLGGDITSIKGFMGNQIYKSDVDDHAAGVVQFDSGANGYFNVSFNARKGFNRIDILGHNGGISIENFIAREKGLGKLVINIDREMKKTFRRRAAKVPYLTYEFQNAILENREPLVTGMDALRNMELIEEFEKQCR